MRQSRKKKLIAAAMVAAALAAAGIAAPGGPPKPTPQEPQPRVMTVPLLSLVAFATPDRPSG